MAKKIKSKQNYIYAQTPNLPLIVWFVSFVLGIFFAFGFFGRFLDLVSFGAIFTWAWLEIFDGANNFRRGLGIVVLVFVFYFMLF